MGSANGTDVQLLALLQAEFPLTPRPYKAIGRRLGISGRRVLMRVKALREKGIIRYIGGMFDPGSLGYESALVAMKCPDKRIDEIAAIVGRHSGVTHNYARTHPFSLWFTITVPPGSNLNEEVQRLAERARPTRTIVLPSVRKFKLRLVLPLSAGQNVAAGFSLRSPRQGRNRAAKLTPADAAAVGELQRDLVISERPFLTVARRLGVTEQTLLRRARSLMRRGVMRRFGAVLHHRGAGFVANCMAVWAVPPDGIANAGRIAASFSVVSHCYERPAAKGWPYTLFAMIHGRSKAECRRIADEVSERIGNPRRALLFTSKEYKKTRPAYFPAR